MSDCPHEQSSLHKAQNDHVEITRLVTKKVFWSLLQDDVLERDRRSLPPGGVGHGRLLTQSHPGEEPQEAHWSVCLLAN